MPLGPAQDSVRDSARLAALRGLGLLDSPPQAGFDRLTRLVRQALRVPVALVSLVEAERQFFLSADGLPEPLATTRETPLSNSFCQHVVTTRAPFRVEDAVEHELVRDNLAVTNLGVVAYLGQPLMTPDGLVLGALCAVDTRKRTWTTEEENALADLASIANDELAFRHFAQELDARVRQETAARLAAQEQLGQRHRLEALGQLAGGVAHDFANVLQAVQGGVRLAAKNLDRDPAAARRVLEAVADAAQRGGSITRRLLGFARRGELRVEQIAPSAVLADLQDVLARTLNLPALRIRIDAQAGQPLVRADRGELETVLINLATNARDAMPDGGTLTLSARAEVVTGDPPTHPAGLRPGVYVRLAAEDTGVGMDQETLARAAEPFFSTKPEGEGTGLGLAMARDFAAQAGGGFAIASEPASGTTVTLWLPAAREAEGAG